MNISGIRPFSGYYNYNTIKTAAVKNEPVEEAAKETAAKTEQQISSKAPESAKSQQKFSSFDFAQMYRPGETGAAKSQDSELRSLDMEKAISDMQKDQVLQQYQFFVGDKAPAAMPSENFDL